MTHTHPDAEALLLCVPESLAGLRLDRALEAMLPEAGLRLRRRLIESGRVLVDGRAEPPGRKLRAGQEISISPERGETTSAAPPPVVARTRDFAAVHKPAGLNSASLAGGGGESLEAMLPALFPGVDAQLLNRLDRLTSGIVLVALTEAGAKRYRALPPGAVTKEYLAVVEGELAEPLELKRRLDTDDRKRTRVLGRLSPESAAWTLVWPQAALPGKRTLVRVRIQSGARHQIRAHLAAAFLPIVGDPLYAEAPGAGDSLYLHHSLLEFKGFRAECPPPWLEELPGATATAGGNAGREES
jgi:23S rRNA pseudouridine1911/1915/1917 synthase